MSGTSPSTATQAQLQSPSLGSPNPWDPSNHEKGLPVLQKLNVGETRPLSPAMQSVLMLTLLYYILYMLPILERLIQKGMYCCRANSGDGKGLSSRPPSILQRICKNAENAMNLIPMLSILILFARLRARVDLESSTPPSFVQTSFFAATCLIYATAVFQDVFFCEGPRVRTAKNAISFLLTMGLYCSIIVIFYGIISASKTAG